MTLITSTHTEAESESVLSIWVYLLSRTYCDRVQHLHTVKTDIRALRGKIWASLKSMISNKLENEARWGKKVFDLSSWFTWNIFGEIDVCSV